MNDLQLRGREAIRWLNKPEVPSHSGLRDMVVSMLLANESVDETVDPEVFKHILLAYDAALNLYATDNDKKFTYVSDDAAWKIFSEKYVAGFRAHFPDVTEERVLEDVTWPELLPRSMDYTTSFLAEVGYALGYYWGRWYEAAQKYAAQFDAEEEKKG